MPSEASSATKTVMPSEPISPAEPPTSFWWNETVFYEVFVRSFKDSDGDGVGDIQGLIEKLDYLNDGNPDTNTDLGITGIWLMPITESPSYHGYDVVDYYDIDQEYGRQEDFKRLIDEAHQRGIKVIIDLVINHTGRDHPWFQASQAGDEEYRDWYIWEDSNPNFLGPWGQAVWHKGGNSYYYGIFWSGMPDLNLENPTVTETMYDITRFWLEEMNVDGFRMDAIRHLVENGAVQENTKETHAWLQAYHQYYKNIDPEAFTVGEAWTLTKQVIEYVGDEVDIAFEFDLAEAFLIAAKGPIVTTLNKQAQKVLDSYPQGQYGVFLTNHDQNRVMFSLKDDTTAKLAASMLLTFPGVPFIYYGEEIGMNGSKPDEDIRLPMQWSGEEGAGFTSGTAWRAPFADYATRNVAKQSADSNSLWSHYQRLIELRNQHAALRTGEAILVDSGSARLYTLLRYNDEEALLVLINPYPNDLAADKFGLTLESGPFTGVVRAETVLGMPNPEAPEINAQGGFENYRPFEVLPAQSSLIIKLTP
jgi:alpha-amylase